MKRYDGTLESLADRSRRPHSHPNQHTPAQLKLISDKRQDITERLSVLTAKITNISTQHILVIHSMTF